jgi:predicted transcriptional regulator
MSEATPRRRGPAARGRTILAMRQDGTKQVVIAVRLHISLNAVKQVIKRWRRRQRVSVAPEPSFTSDTS